MPITDSLGRVIAARGDDPQRDALEAETETAQARVRERRLTAPGFEHRQPDLNDFRFRQAMRQRCAQRAERRRKTDSGLIAKLLSTLVNSVDGKSLEAVFGEMARTNPSLGPVVGLLGENSFWDGFANALTTITDQGLTVRPPAARADAPVENFARSLGMTPDAAKRIQRSTPRAVKRFDEFTASMPADPATLQAALEAGSADSLPLGFIEAVSALIGAMRGAASSNDAEAMRAIGSDFGSLVAALHEATRGTPAQRSATGHERRRRYEHEWIEIKDRHWVAKSECERGDDGVWRPKPGVLSRGSRS